MAELKTKQNNKSVDDFLSGIEKEQKRKDSFVILEIIKEIYKEEPKMWGNNIIGFGGHHYKYKTGREGDWFKIGFSPRKQNIVIYFMDYLDEKDVIFQKIGKYKIGKACFYINKLADINIEVLKELIQQSYDDVSKSNY